MEKHEYDMGFGGKVLYFPKVIKTINMERIVSCVDWKQIPIKFMGKTHLQPRMIAYFSDLHDHNYKYSTCVLTPNRYDSVSGLRELQDEIENLTDATYNSCLMNLYRNGDDYVSYHADNEKIYGNDPFNDDSSMFH